jgi:uncharacterized protein (TIGR02757 family)
MEVAGLLASSLAYGRVRQIERDVSDLLGRMEGSPYEYIMHFDKRKRAAFIDFKHRFNTGDDVCELLLVLRKALESSGSIERHFLQFYDSNDETVLPAMTGFVGSLMEIHRRSGGRGVSKGFAYLVPSPAAGSACKRLNMFLRWMVRSDDVDAGLWKGVDTAKLIVPIDVHMGRLCRILGFHDRKTVSAKTALEITRNFAQIEPADPVKYDFCLSRIGIIEDCTGAYRLECEGCEIFEWCSKRKDWR